METCVVRRISIRVDGGAADRQLTVLLVTDDADMRAAAGRALERAGYRVLTAAHSGHAVLACMRGGPVDLLVTELAMEEGSGPGLAERLRRHHPELHTVYLGKAGTPECDGVLVRPFTRDELLSQLEAGVPA